jgi:hypothetical protein
MHKKDFFYEKYFDWGSFKIFISISVKKGIIKFIFSIRFLISLMIFFAISLQYAQKIDMGIAIVCMVNNTALNGNSTHNKTINYYNYQETTHIVRY